MKPNHLIANSCTTYMQYSQNISISASSLQGINERNNINAVITPLKQCLNAVL